jgi:hypothetical protein
MGKEGLAGLGLASDQDRQVTHRADAKNHLKIGLIAWLSPTMPSWRIVPLILSSSIVLPTAVDVVRSAAQPASVGKGHASPDRSG